MIITIAKPAMAAFARDIAGSVDALQRVRMELGIAERYKVNDNLTLDTGLQLIIRNSDIDSLGKLEENVKPVRDAGVTLAIHAPYNYDDPAKWSESDLSQGDRGFSNLLRVVEFGDKIGAHSIAVHPNAIRTSEYLASEAYTREERMFALESVIDRIFAAQNHSNVVGVHLENKPFPTTTPDNEKILYSIAGAPLADIMDYTRRGGMLTFDTCHYGISMKNFNAVLEANRDGKLPVDLKNTGYFPEDYKMQPSIKQAMLDLGGAIRHIHLNDGSVFRPINETGEPNREARLPVVNGHPLYWEGYVPGKGELCGYDVIMPWINQQAAEGNRSRTILTVEVTEFDGNYKESPRFVEGAVGIGRAIIDSLH